LGNKCGRDVVEIWGSAILRCSDSVIPALRRCIPRAAALRRSASVSRVKEYLATAASKIWEVMGVSDVSGVKGWEPVVRATSWRAVDKNSLCAGVWVPEV
jgi:hypothetical protein